MLGHSPRKLRPLGSGLIAAVTHGHLAENDNHGGTGASVLPDARRTLAGARTGSVDIAGFVYLQGYLTANGKAARPPTSSRAAR